jgi:hypothetical protein
LQPYNVKTTKKDLIARAQNHNIEKWKNDPLAQEIYALATNQNRTAADDIRFNQLRDQQTKRDYELRFNSTEPIKEYPTQAEETKAKRVLDFVNFNVPRERRFVNKK